MSDFYDVLIIGGGVVGSAAARELSKYNIKTALLEKEADVAEGTSKANSGVLHAGFNVRPGSLKAELNVEGLLAFPGLADELGVPWEPCEKLVVAFREDEFSYLEKLLEQGKKNGCTGLSIIGREEIRRLEPNVRGERALYSQSTGIITPYKFTIALAENAVDNGVDIFLSSEVTAVVKNGESFKVVTDKGVELKARTIINSAGLYSGEIARMAGACIPETYPCRGEYFIVDRKAGREPGCLMRRAVYPVPPADGRGLGVHLTPTMNGNILIGPSAGYVQSAGDLENTRPVMELLKKEAMQLLPELKEFDLIKSYSGNRAKLFGPDESVSFSDFYIEESREVPGMINLAGIESPGLTASPAIARMLKDMIGERHPLIKKESFNPRRKGAVRIDRMTPNEREKLIQTNPDFGEIVCRCEGVSRGEILAALDNPLGVATLNGIKKRTHAMMGRCQSGFCLPRILSILKDRGIRPEEIYRDGPEGFVVAGDRNG